MYKPCSLQVFYLNTDSKTDNVVGRTGKDTDGDIDVSVHFSCEVVVSGGS